MNSRPLVSVITGTRDRLHLILDCIAQVRNQDYRPLEHVIVSDGPDQTLADLIDMVRPSDVPIVYAQTGRVWSDELEASPGTVPFQVAQYLARGEVQMWLSDDEEMDPDHISLLVDLMEREQADFVYSKAFWYTNPDLPELQKYQYIIGSSPPRPDQITNCLYRTALLDYGKFETHLGRGTDWYQVSRWIEAGARYAFLNQVTFSHRADQVGGTYPIHHRQALRGHTEVLTCS